MGLPSDALPSRPWFSSPACPSKHTNSMRSLLTCSPHINTLFRVPGIHGILQNSLVLGNPSYTVYRHDLVTLQMAGPEVHQGPFNLERERTGREHLLIILQAFMCSRTQHFLGNRSLNLCNHYLGWVALKKGKLGLQVHLTGLRYDSLRDAGPGILSRSSVSPGLSVLEPSLPAVPASAQSTVPGTAWVLAQPVFTRTAPLISRWTLRQWTCSEEGEMNSRPKHGRNQGWTGDLIPPL